MNRDNGAAATSVDVSRQERIDADPGTAALQVQTDGYEPVLHKERALRASLLEQVAGQQDVILEQQQRLAAVENERDTALQRGRELEARLEAARIELYRSQGQVAFIRDLMAQQVRW